VAAQQPITLADVDNMTVIELKAALKKYNEVGMQLLLIAYACLDCCLKLVLL
jgi:hypothetical protein